VNAPLIEVRDLHFRYEDGTPALNGVDFVLRPGESVALLGPNGSGKTTFVLHLNGLLHGEGNIQVCGLKAAKENLPSIRQKIGMLFQDADEQLFMPTVLEDVAFGPLNLGFEPEAARERAVKMLERVGVSHAVGKAPYHLSAGEKRRVALAGVLAMDPEILIMDEPTTFLDPPGHRDLVDLLRSLPQAKILVTHDIGFARALASRADFFSKGRIIDSGSVEDVAGRQGWTTYGG
jgi:cobalt/nickel transport system ATP-binding protein